MDNAQIAKNLLEGKICSNCRYFSFMNKCPTMSDYNTCELWEEFRINVVPMSAPAKTLFYINYEYTNKEEK